MYDKKDLRRMIEANSLPKHLKKIFEEAKKYVYYHANELLVDRSIKA